MEDGTCAKFFAMPLINLRSDNNVMTMNRVTKKAALGGPKGENQLVLLLATASYLAYFYDLYV